jgi:hypothetical protein
MVHGVNNPLLALLDQFTGPWNYISTKICYVGPMNKVVLFNFCSYTHADSIWKFGWIYILGIIH